MNMQANSGESIYSLAQRAIRKASCSNSEVLATHNDVTICIYPSSCVHDVLDKFTMQRAINNLKGVR